MRFVCLAFLYSTGFDMAKMLKRRLYCLFALVLTLHFLQYCCLKSMNSLLKVNDLLSSLPAELIQKTLPEYGMQMVLAIESACIKSLAEEKGLGYVFV